MSSVIYKINKPKYKGKLASFDYDWTIVNPKEGKTYPSNINDWEWYHPSVPGKIKEYYDDGYMIVIFTNQSKDWKHKQIRIVSRSLKIPMFVVVASKPNYKPQTKMFDTLFKDNQIDKSQSFFVGDALGRNIDFSDSDKQFAINIGIKCYSPEEIFFKEEKISIPEIIPKSFIYNKSNPEIIIMTGYPGSGKSTIVDYICNSDGNYKSIKSDDYKTTPKMLKKAKEYIINKSSIIFDATNSSIKKRNEYIIFAKKNNYHNIKCIHLTTQLSIAFKRNRLKKEEKQVPKIAYSVYTKHDQEPSSQEGFQLIKI